MFDSCSGIFLAPLFVIFEITELPSPLVLPTAIESVIYVAPAIHVALFLASSLQPLLVQRL